MRAGVAPQLGQPGVLLPNFVDCSHSDRLGRAFTGHPGQQHRGLMLANHEHRLQDVLPAAPQEEFNDRLELRSQRDDAFRASRRAASAAAHQSNDRRSADLMRAEDLRAFDLSLESAATRSRYAPRVYGPNEAGYNGLR